MFFGLITMLIIIRLDVLTKIRPKLSIISVKQYINPQGG